MQYLIKSFLTVYSVTAVPLLRMEALLQQTQTALLCMRPACSPEDPGLTWVVQVCATFLLHFT